MSQRGILGAASKSNAGIILGNSLGKNLNFSSAAKSKIPLHENDIPIEQIEENEDESGLHSINNIKDIVDENELEEEKSEENDNKNNIKFDVSSKEGFKELLRFQMRIFDQNYDFDQDQLIGGVALY